eukprot:4665398-Amphidinium_carterae.1
MAGLRVHSVSTSAELLELPLAGNVAMKGRGKSTLWHFSWTSLSLEVMQPPSKQAACGESRATDSSVEGK